VVFRRRQRPRRRGRVPRRAGDRHRSTDGLRRPRHRRRRDDRGGVEANGWIVIRNPVPTLVFYFIVLSQLLRLGETDAADNLAEALAADGEDVRDPLLVPRSAEISDDAWRVSTPASVGDDRRLHGNLRAESIRVGERNEVFGSLRAREGITVGADTTIHGDVTTRGGTVTVEAGARVLGDVSAGDPVVHDGAEIDGTLARSRRDETRSRNRRWRRR